MAYSGSRPQSSYTLNGQLYGNKRQSSYSLVQSPSTSSVFRNSTYGPVGRDQEFTPNPTSLLGQHHERSSSADLYSHYGPLAPAYPGDAESKEYMLNTDETAPMHGNDWDAREARVAGTRTTFVDRWKNRVKKGFEFKKFIFVLFALLVALAITLYFVIPRVPEWVLNTDTPLGAPDPNPTATNIFTRQPAAFNFNATVHLAVKTDNNWLRLHFPKLSMKVWDLTSGKLLATGNMDGWSVKAKGTNPVDFPITFNYLASNLSDSTWNSWYAACAHQYPTDPDRPTVGLAMTINMAIRGMIGTKGQSTQIASVACPIQLATANQ